MLNALRPASIDLQFRARNFPRKGPIVGRSDGDHRAPTLFKFALQAVREARVNHGVVGFRFKEPPEEAVCLCAQAQAPSDFRWRRQNPKSKIGARRDREGLSGAILVNPSACEEN